MATVPTFHSPPVASTSVQNMDSTRNIISTFTKAWAAASRAVKSRMASFERSSRKHFETRESRNRRRQRRREKSWSGIWPHLIRIHRSQPVHFLSKWSKLVVWERNSSSSKSWAKRKTLRLLGVQEDTIPAVFSSRMMDLEPFSS